MERDILAEGKYWQQVYKELGGLYICSECGKVFKKPKENTIGCFINFSLIAFFSLILIISIPIFVVFLGFMSDKPGSQAESFVGYGFGFCLLFIFFGLFVVFAELKPSNEDNKKCPKCKCGSKKTVFINSPEGKELLKQYYPEQFKIVENL